MSEDSTDKRIVFGTDSKDFTEVTKPSDKLIVDKNLFKGQLQTDGDLCAYLVLAAQMHLGKDNSRKIDVSERVISGTGFKKIAEMVREEVGHSRLSTFESQDILAKRAPDAKKIKLSEYISEDESLFQASTRMLKEGYLPGLILDKEDHAVLGVGYSQGEDELVVLDALSGSGDPRLRRIPSTRDDLWFTGAVEVDQVFRK